MAKDPELLTHLEWLGYLQPVGLVVSPPALVSAQAFPAKNIIPEHSRFLEVVEETVLKSEANPRPVIRDIPRFATQVLRWEPTDIVGTKEGGPVPDTLEVPLPEYNETLRPTYAVPEYDQSSKTERKWLLLIQRVPVGLNLDEIPETESKDHQWQASPQARFERLLRETQVPIGLLSNDIQLRLVYAPRGETSGYLTFPVQAMTEVAGRPIFAALQMLLSSQRLFSLGDKQRLPAILAESRKYQNLVSNKLAEQVLAALYELLRGFQAADDQRHGELLRAVLEDDPSHVYSGLLTVLLRLVFLLYAEDRSLLSSDEVYQKFYSVTGLFERLRADAGRYTDTMDHRYGAWAQLLTLFRLIYEGGRHGGMHLPPRKGYLFDPDRYAFLEGRGKGSQRQPDEHTEPPRVSDGVVFRVLQNLLILDGERLSYRTLDVEQIGSVYETMMGFNLEVARGRSIAIKPAKAHGAPTTINLEELLSVAPAERAKWLKTQSDQALTGEAAAALKDAQTSEDGVAALERKVARAATPNIVPAGAMVLQPSDERRKSGSHYTPRSLTEPIVRTTLRPILERLGSDAKPEQILDLKICDPAMGSGAFLVEACRQLGDVLVKAWHVHNRVPKIPPDEDEVLHARRLIAQRCLYSVDKNPMAVDLAKLSLWLATLARDHPFTFLDHALRHGDSLVGLTRQQIADFHWLPPKGGRVFGQEQIEQRIQAATRARQEIIEAGDEVPFLLKQQKLAAADDSLNLVRFAGNLVIAAFFAGANDKERKRKREELLQQFSHYLRSGDMKLRPTQAEQELRSGAKAIQPFHWEIEFPEVFGREKGGFDAMVGNPPFMGGRRISSEYGEQYRDWLPVLHQESNSNSDLVAHFFRRAFTLSSAIGTFGMIATKTIAQGDTRATGLQWICCHTGIIYNATRRLKWPGQAAVVVSVVHVGKGISSMLFELDGRAVPIITAHLFPSGGHDNPAALRANKGRSFQGCITLGMGFTFDDSDKNSLASPIAEMHKLINKDARNAERIFPYIGGEEVNTDPTHSHHRYVINFAEMDMNEAGAWPDLLEVLEKRVKPERINNSKEVAKWPWWQFWRPRADLLRSMHGMKRVLVIAQTSNSLAFAFMPSGTVFGHTLIVFPIDSFSAFAVLQSRVHQSWALFLAAKMKDDARYIPSDCFETFPFPENFETDPKLEAVGKEYYQFRAELMVKNNEGLTKTYNRFHDPGETAPDIHKLRELHAAMDRAVLDAYGWTDLVPTCTFLLDYEEEDEDDDTAPARKKKKPWRYRWPDDFRDELLARLLELNKQRAEQERLSGATAEPKTKKAGKKGKSATGCQMT